VRLIVAFASLAAGAILTIAGVKGASIASVLKGSLTPSAATSLAGVSTTAAGPGGVGSTVAAAASSLDPTSTSLAGEDTSPGGNPATDVGGPGPASSSEAAGVAAGRIPPSTHAPSPVLVGAESADRAKVSTLEAQLTAAEKSGSVSAALLAQAQAATSRLTTVEAQIAAAER
jgi:hypothetical protein